MALVAPYDLAVPGGVQAQVLGLARALVGLGAEAAVLAPGTPGPRSAAGLRLEGAGRSLALPANGSRAPVALGPGALARTRRFLASFDPDVVHVHEPFVPGPALASLIVARVPVVATFHRAGAGAGYRLAGLALRRLLGRLDDVVAVSEAARETLLAVVGPGAGRCSIEPNGVDLERFVAAVPAARAAPVVCFVGRHEQRKGLAVLLEAFASLEIEARCWVVGTGPLSAPLRARYGADPRVEWLGVLGDAELASHLAAADVLAAPSLGGESFGVVLLEAMAAGAAVVASDLPGYRDAAGDAACYVPPGDARCLAAALRSLLTDRSRREHLVAAGHRRVAPRGFPALAQRYLARYEAARRR
ncbi:MAG TPA: glycosyltransferase family 4 protein [Acidimicrobiales bacterium]|nr:glycosyltransferase family 4 protein [Acidimicrobiales bacterium]